MTDPAIPPMTGRPHSPGDVLAGQQRQETRPHAPTVESHLLRRKPELSFERSPLGAQRMRVWMAAYTRANGDEIGGHWVLVSTRAVGMKQRLAAPVVPSLEPVQGQPSGSQSQPSAGAIQGGSGKVNAVLASQFKKLQQSIGLSGGAR